LTWGPGFDTLRGVRVQATGQKIVAFVAIVCICVQSWGAIRLEADT